MSQTRTYSNKAQGGSAEITIVFYDNPRSATGTYSFQRSDRTVVAGAVSTWQSAANVYKGFAAQLDHVKLNNPNEIPGGLGNVVITFSNDFSKIEKISWNFGDPRKTEPFDISLGDLRAVTSPQPIGN
jgi:hypothetical protein